MIKGRNVLLTVVDHDVLRYQQLPAQRFVDGDTPGAVPGRHDRQV
jgi:hypothetical protein